MAGSNACWLDVAKLPGGQYANKQENRNANSHAQGQGHLVAFRSLLEHEIQRRAKAGEDGKEGKQDEVFHVRHYPMNAVSRFWLMTLAAGLAIALTIGLGQWQLSRASDKEALADAIANQANQPALSSLELAARAAGTGVMHRPVLLQGRWLPEHTVFLDNRQMNAKPGLFVVTPLALTDSPAVVLVQRGWVQRNFLDRNSLPVIDTPAGTVTIGGRIAPPPSKLYELGDPQAGRIRQNLDMTGFARESGLSLLPVSVQQVGAQADGLQRDWSQPATGVDKHYGYAAQWFGLSGLFAILYVWFQIVKKFKPRR